MTEDKASLAANHPVYDNVIFRGKGAVGFGCFLLGVTFWAVLQATFNLIQVNVTTWGVTCISGIFALGLYSTIRGILEVLLSKKV